MGSDASVTILDDERVHIYESYIGHAEKIGVEVVEQLDSVRRVVVAGGSNTSDTVYGVLYVQKEDGMVEVDSEATGSFPSYLKGYFYHKHDFKMLEKCERDADYEKTYDPSSHADVEYACPNCRETNIDIQQWNGRCEDCGYTGTEPRFNTQEGTHRGTREVGYRRDIRSEEDIKNASQNGGEQ